MIETLLSTLDKVKPAGERAWVARCPAHDDKEPSLSISQGEKAVVMHCHAGCSTKEILDSVNLTWGELFPDNGYQKSDTAAYAKQVWDAAQVDVVRFHPYAQKKKITHDFGARRGRASGRLVGRDADCIIVPMRSWDGELVGVECINADGTKQTFGSKGQLILGYPEGADWIHVTEGWASMWGVAQMRPKSFGGVVVFGKSRMEGQRGAELEREIENRFGGTAVRHNEFGKADAWDHWNLGNAEKYLTGRFL